MKKPACEDAGGSGDKSRIAGATLFDLQPAYGTAPTHIALSDTLAEHVEALQAIYGQVAFLSPNGCAACGDPMPAGPRDTLAIGALNAAPVVFFLCPPCLEENKRNPAAVEERVYSRIDAAAALQYQLSRNARA